MRWPIVVQILVLHGRPLPAASLMLGTVSPVVIEAGGDMTWPEPAAPSAASTR